ncbi:MAG: arsenite methyltransferase [Saprospiraceae bacterium]|nr:arsenite methyltransferase [Saprospiraceae bacterium]
MENTDSIKKLVQEKYTEIAEQSGTANQASCCGATNCSTEVYNIMTDDYTALEGYNQDADLGLGCGLPTAFAQIEKGDTVIDLGSGAGNDCFIARHETGEEGKVIGIDFTPAMIRKARENAAKLEYNNVEFRQGDIEEMPALDNEADVIVSNCVLNLVPNKKAVISEIFRVLKPGGHFSISDIVLQGALPDAILKDVEMYAGCVAGAIQMEDYMQLIEDAGFEQITIQKQKTIEVPDDILSRYLDRNALDAFKASGTGIFSITVFAAKPGSTPKTEKRKVKIAETLACCEPGSGCC